MNNKPPGKRLTLRLPNSAADAPEDRHSPRHENTVGDQPSKSVREHPSDTVPTSDDPQIVPPPTQFQDEPENIDNQRQSADGPPQKPSPEPHPKQPPTASTSSQIEPIACVPLFLSEDCFNGFKKSFHAIQFEFAKLRRQLKTLEERFELFVTNKVHITC